MENHMAIRKTEMTRMDLRYARILARQVDGSPNPVHYQLNCDSLRRAWHRLETSRPATSTLQREDRRLAAAIGKYISTITA